ncbi:MAG: glycosyltransferase [Acidobacteria bacterium]|nr:glycosyltransferase [Acidobacteriota bacterium]
MTNVCRPSAGETQSSEILLRKACRVVIVNWNSGSRLHHCLESIPSEFQVVVVDNASSDHSLDDLCNQDRLEDRSQPKSLTGSNGEASLGCHLSKWQRSHRQPRDLRIIRNQQNEGFAGAANRGAAGCASEFLLFLNPDVSFCCETSADVMLCLLRVRPRAAAATGRLVHWPHRRSGGRRPRRSCNLICPLPTLWSALSNVLFFDEVLQRPMVRRMSPKDLCSTVSPEESEPERIQQAPGACLLIRRAIFEKLGGFDSSFHPAWFEDVDLCKRLANLGLEIFYHPQAVFRHEGGYSVDLIGEPEFNRIFYCNMIRYFKKHHGPGAVVFLRAAVSIGNAMRRLFHILT